MAENEIMDPAPTPENQPQPSGETQPAPTEPAINLDSTIQMDGKEVSIRELLDQNSRLGELEAYRSAASTVMKGAAVPQETRESAMRYVLGSEGYTQDQIEAHIDLTRQMADDVDSGEYENPAPQPENYEQMQQMEQQRAMEEQRIRDMEARQARLGVDMLKRDLNEAVDAAMETNDKIKTLVEKSRELGGDEGLDQRIAGIREEVQRATMESLRARKSRGETFDKSWFSQETTKAADSVYQRIRSVIGDPDKIQRAPETASEQDSFISTPPVEAPEFAKGDNIGDVQSKSRDWTTDTLARLAADVSDGGETKL